jgi:hypothetical protein
MELKFVLDFDGVLFNSAFEAYTVANTSVRDIPDYRQEVSFEEFLEFRSVVVDAWQYNRLYSEPLRLRDFSDLPQKEPGHDDWDFAKRFFAARAEIMRDADWPKIMSPYDFFFQLRPLLLSHPERFTILSTRNVESIRQTMAFYDADVLQVFGQEDIRRTGSKIEVAAAQGWLERGRYLVVYVDDMNAHLEPFEGKVHLPLHADWGYDKAKTDSLSQHQIITIISSLLKLSDPSDAHQV